MSADPHKTGSKRKSPLRWLWWPLGVLAVVVALALVAAPYAIRYTVAQWLQAAGAERVHIGAVRFNPLNSTVSLRDIDSQTGDAEGLTIRSAILHLRWNPLHWRHLEISAGDISQARVTVGQRAGAWRLGGLDWKALQARPFPAIARLSVHDSSLRYHVAGQSNRLIIRDARLTNLDPANAQGASRLRLQGQLDEAPVHANAELFPFAATPHGEARLRLDDLPLRVLKPVLAPDIAELSGRLKADMKVRVERRQDRSVSVQADGTASVANLRAQTPAVQLQTPALNWQGRLSSRAAAPFATRVTARGRLEDSGLRLAMPARDLLIVADNGQWQGQVDYGRQDVPTGFELSGDFLAKRVRIDKPREGIELLRAQTARLSDLLAYGTHAVSSAGAELQQVAWARPASADANAAADGGSQWLLRAGAVTAEGISATELKDWVLEKLDVRDGRVRLQRDAQAHWRLAGLYPQHMFMLQDGKAPEHTVRVGELRFSGDSRLQFVDEAVTPRYQTTVRLADAHIVQLDSATPLRASAIAIDGIDASGASLRLRGALAPFAPRAEMDLTLALRNLPLAPLSGYARQGLGCAIGSGTLNGTLQWQATGERFTSNNQLRFSKLALQGCQTPATAPGEPLSLPSAVAVLTDASGNLTLTVPVEADLGADAPPLSTRVVGSLRRAARVSSIHYLSAALQPFGTILSVQPEGNDREQRIRLNPVLFARASSALSTDEQRYLDKVGQLLRQRSGIVLRLCPHAGVDEGRGSSHPASARSNDALHALAQQRVQAVKEFLIERFHIRPQRLSVCKPSRADPAGEEARVELFI